VPAPALNQSDQDSWLSRWTIGGKGKEPGRPPRPRLRATNTRAAGVWHLLAVYELAEDKP
jgi:hypothetical protein